MTEAQLYEQIGRQAISLAEKDTTINMLIGQLYKFSTGEQSFEDFDITPTHFGPKEQTLRSVERFLAVPSTD